ncbi:class I adenylate-forming enzyme family protein [Nocardia higoensis]|uniref:class I adenylate-forming enzyme family protein n=1 Tax=Nocardia higoensis TaxID=228599 RepID=UPI00030CC081|nr:AMP-binding protein [Nocardia higoensis]
MTDLLADRIARRVTRQPDARAVITADARIGYAEFWSRVLRTASGLDGMGRVAVLPTSDIESLVVVTAAMRAGVSVVLLHRHLTAAQLRRVLDLARPGAVVAAARQHHRLRRLGCESAVTAAALESDGSHHTAAPTDELLVGITSGTTGEPKLFVRDQRSWAATLNRSDRTFGIEEGDRVAVPGVLDHTHFLYGALHTLTRGATVDLRGVEHALDEHTTHLYSVPAIAWDVARSGLDPLPGVREVLSSAARWPRPGREALRRVLPNASLVHFYGASELSFVSYDRDLGGDGDRGAGELFDGVDAEIRDGLVHVRSDMLFTGYLTEQGVTGGPVDGWTTVGDRGRLDGRRLTLFGRDSDMLIRGGLNVEPAAVESALIGLPGISEAACIGIPDARMGQVPVAAMVAGPGAPTVAEVRTHLRRVLPAPSMPVRILRLASLPRTPRGKLDRHALIDLFAAQNRSDPATR